MQKSFIKFFFWGGMFFSLLAFMCLTNPVAAQEKDKINKVDDEFKILQLLPNGQVKDLNQIVVMFNKPMVKLGEYETALDKNILNIEPKIEGSFYWLNQYTLAYNLKEPLKGSTELTVAVKEGLKSLDGEILKKGRKATISLPPLAINNLFALEFDYGENNKVINPLKPVFLIAYSQPINSETLKDKIKFVLEADKKEYDTVITPITEKDLKDGLYSNYFYVHASEANKYKNMYFKVQAKSDLPKNTNFNIVQKKGVQSLVGNVPSAEIIYDKNKRKLSTYEPLEVKLSGYSEKEKKIDPDSDPSIKFNNRVDLLTAAKNIKINNDYDTKKLIEFYGQVITDEDGVKTQANRFGYNIQLTDLKPESEYKVEVNVKDIKDAFGQEFSGKKEINFLTGEFKTSFNGPESLGVFENESEAKLLYKVRNLAKIEINALALNPEEYIKFLSDINLSPEYFYFNNNDENKNKVKALFRKHANYGQIIEPQGAAKQGYGYEVLNLKELYKDKAYQNKVMLIKSSWAKKDDYNENKGVDLITEEFSTYQISNLSILAKLGYESSLVWVTNIKDASFVSEANLKLFDARGKIIWEGQTDQNGLAQLPGANELEIDAEAKENVYIAAQSKDGDFLLWSNTWKGGVNLWRYSYYNYPSKAGFYRVSLLSALPLYKPGEEANFKIIARNAEGLVPEEFKNKEFKVSINDANNVEVFSENKKFNEFGTLSAKFKLANKPSLGNYYVSFKEVKENDKDNYGTYAGNFMVAEYRPPAFDIKVEPLPENIISGDKVELKSQAKYHFGSPVSKQEVNYTVQAFETDISLPGVATDYSLVNHFILADNYEDSENGYSPSIETFSSGEGKLDVEGKFNFTINLAKETKTLIKPYRYEASVKVTDVDKREISKKSSFTVHPAEVYVGLKLNSFLAEAGKPMAINYLVADLNGQLIAEKEIEYKVYKRSWKNSRRKTPGAVYGYSSKAVDTLISTEKVVSGTLPKIFEVTPKEAGYYYVVASILDSKERVNQASLSFYTIGDNAAGWYMENKDNTLELISDKNEYAIGETAKIMLKSPFSEGKALVTVERAGVKSSKIYDVTNNTPVFDIPISEDAYPNTYVSVSLLRGRTGEKLDDKGVDFGKPSARIGYLELNVKSEKDILMVEVKPSKTEVKAGEELEVSLKVQDFKGAVFNEAEVALIVADAATLQLVEDDNYYPHKKFHVKQNLMVETSNSLFSLVGRRNWGLKGANPGGGGANMAMAAAGLDKMQIRDDFSNLAYYNPNLKLNEQGEVTVKFKMPENLTTFKIYAVAISKNLKMGTGLSEVVVTKDLLIRSSLPAYMGTEDVFMASLVLNNRSQNKGLAKVELTGENFTLLEDSNLKTIALGPNEGQEVSFKVKAINDGEAKFVFKTVMGEESDAVQYIVPVYPANKLKAEASYEQLLPGEKNVKLSILDTDLKRGFLELELSPSLLGSLKEPFMWVNEYPHKCLESTTSKAYANLLMLNLKERIVEKDLPTEKELKAKINEHIAKLKSLEDDGAFTYWESQRYSWVQRSPYLTAYVLEFLIEAKKAGFENVDNALLERSSSYLKNIINDSGENFKNYSERGKRDTISYIVNVLNLAGNNVKAETELLYAQRKTASLFELNNILKLMENNEQKEEIIGLISNQIYLTAGEISLKQQDYHYGLWFSDVANLATTLEALLVANEKHEYIPYILRFLIKENKNGYYLTTQNNVRVLKAFSLYAKKVEGGTENINIEAFLNKESFLKAKFTNFQEATVKSNMPLTNVSEKEAVVNYKTTGEGQAWANLKLFTAPKEADLKAKSSGGFQVQKTYQVIRPEKSKEGISEFKRGDVVKITLTMLVPANRHNVILEDRIPAGFEAINFDFKTADSTLIGEIDSSYNSDEISFWWPSYNHQEIWPEKVAVYYDRLVPGVYTYSYLARAITEGEYLTPGARAEEMYAPETFGQSEGAKVIVK